MCLSANGQKVSMMPEIRFEGLESLELSMKEIAEIPDSVKDEMLQAEAAVLVPVMRAKAQAYGLKDTGLMIDSIKPGKPKKTKTGRALYVTPQGKRRRGKQNTRNAEIAFIGEYGTKKIKARPFMRDAAAAAAEQVEQAAFGVYDAWLKSKNL